jgi:hypothetical protein
MPPDVPQRWLAMLIAVAFEGGLGLTAWLLGWLVSQPPLATLRWELRDLGLGVAAAVPMIVSGVLLSRWPIGPLAKIERFIEEVVRPFFAGCTVLDLGLVSLVAGVAEEALVRGVIQGALARWLGVWAGLILASVLFGLLHFVTLSYVVLAALAGLYLGLVWMATGNLLAAIVAHAVYDFAMLVYLVRWTGEKAD